MSFFIFILFFFFFVLFVSIMFSYNSHGVRNDHLKYASANLETSKINNINVLIDCLPRMCTKNTRQNCT